MKVESESRNCVILACYITLLDGDGCVNACIVQVPHTTLGRRSSYRNATEVALLDLVILNGAWPQTDLTDAAWNCLHA